MDNDELCKQVLDLDPKIRFAALISPMGRLVAGGMKPGLLSLEESRDNEMIYMQLALKVNLRKAFDKAFGPVKFSMAYRENLILMSFPLDGNIFFISAEKNIDFYKLAFKILEVINSKAVS
ncbi:MAG: DUF6659 family protein [Nitrosotalea sp.]